ncbi:MAG: SNF2-related protein [Isosphaeraceae bacterium]
MKTIVLRKPVESTEAYRTLLSKLGKKGGKIPAEALVRHILAIVPADEWPVRVEALDAVVRRIEAARRDALKIASRPAGGLILGAYSVRSKAGARPYRTVLEGGDPLAGRCDCPDFLRNSLGLCKHLVAILDQVFSKPRALQAARKEQAEWAPFGLGWDPIRPLTGPGDWLERVTWRPDERVTARNARALAWFRPAAGGTFSLKKAYPDRPERRLPLVESLCRVIEAEGEGGDPALAALLRAERVRLRWIRKLSMTPAQVREGIKGLKKSLYPYQKEGVSRFLSTGRLLLADDMGLGKTAQAIAAADILRRAGRVRRALLIVPASLKPQWAREWAQFSDRPLCVLDGSPEDRRHAYASSKPALFLINYEQLLRDLPAIQAWSPDLVILDEAQRIKNWATKTALAVKQLTPSYRLVLTGTPMENRIEELASVVEWVDDLALEPKWRLGAVHAIREDGRHEVKGARNLDTLRDRLRPCMVRRTRPEVLDQLPPRTDVRVPIELTEAQLFEHDSLNQPIAALVQVSMKRPLTQAEFLRLMQLLTTQRIICNGLAQQQFEDLWPSIQRQEPDEGMLRSLSAPKLSELRPLIRQVAIEQGRKVVVFSQWRRMLALAQWAVGDILRENGMQSGYFSGNEGAAQRARNLVHFHDDPAFRVLFASDAGGVGLNLQHAANCVINLELPWNPAVLEQRIGRIYRLGQKQPIDVYNLVCEQGIESRIAGLVESKQAFFKGLFDGTTDSVRFDQSGSFLSRVRRLYDPADLAAAVDAGPGLDGEAIDTDDADLDDTVIDPIGPILGPADSDAIPEASDSVAALEPAASAGGIGASTSPECPGIAPEPGPLSDSGLAAPSAGVGDLFGRLRFRREADGRVIIEAPPEAATALCDLFQGMAGMFRALAEGGTFPTEPPAARS